MKMNNYDYFGSLFTPSNFRYGGEYDEMNSLIELK